MHLTVWQYNIDIFYMWPNFPSATTQRSPRDKSIYFALILNLLEQSSREMPFNLFSYPKFLQLENAHSTNSKTNSNTFKEVLEYNLNYF